MLNNELENQLKKLRLSKGKSLQEIAEAIDVSKAHVYNLISINMLIGEYSDSSDNERLVSMFWKIKVLEDLNCGDRMIMYNILQVLLNE